MLGQEELRILAGMDQGQASVFLDDDFAKLEFRRHHFLESKATCSTEKKTVVLPRGRACAGVLV
jgi:hypothetical protein